MASSAFHVLCIKCNQPHSTWYDEVNALGHWSALSAIYCIDLIRSLVKLITTVSIPYCCFPFPLTAEQAIASIFLPKRGDQPCWHPSALSPPLPHAAHSIRGLQASQVAAHEDSVQGKWACKAQGFLTAKAWQLGRLRNSNPGALIFCSFASWGELSINSTGAVLHARGECIGRVGSSLGNGCLRQNGFLCRNLFMSFAPCLHFPLCSRVSARAGWRSVLRLILHVEKMLFLSFIFLSSAYTTSCFLKSAESFFFYFKFPKHWSECVLSCILLWLPLLSGCKFTLLQI